MSWHVHVVLSSSPEYLHCKAVHRCRGFDCSAEGHHESFQTICNGDVDHIPLSAFYNIGGMDDVMRRYEEIKAQTGAK